VPPPRTPDPRRPGPPSRRSPLPEGYGKGGSGSGAGAARGRAQPRDPYAGVVPPPEPVPDPAGRPGPRRPRRSGRQRAVLTLLGAVLAVTLLGVACAGYVLHKYLSIQRVGDINVASAPPGEPENYLVVAIDTRDGLDIRNTDTIMIVRIDPRSDRVALTSFNRDLMVEIADTGRIGMINSAYNRPNGEQVLIDTIRRNFDIPINHFVEVNFESFKQVVDAVGGVPMWIPYPVRDTHTGLFQTHLGCATLNGEQGLAFARSRYFQVLRPNGRWDQDGSADLGRVQRQQVFTERAMSKALAQVRSNPARLPQLVDIGLKNVRIDKSLSLGDLLSLGRHFKGFDPSKLESYPLPVKEYPPDPNRLLLDESGAEPYLNVFRGLAPGEIRPGLVEVTVENGTQGTKPTLAGDVSGALAKIGFTVDGPRDADRLYERTVVFHAPGQVSYAQRVARHLTVPAQLQVDPALAPGHVRLVAGTDFTTVHEQPGPITPVTAATPSTTAPAAGAPATTAPPATVPPPTTTTTAPTGFVVGNPPPGKQC
jgi:LCP family protein required for cell wall assembly